MKLDKFLEASPVFWIYVSHSEIFKEFQGELNQENLTFVQGLILVGVFFEESDINPSGLAQSLRVSPSVISHAIRVLIDEGLLQRKQMENDARRNYFRVTATGKRRVEKLIKLFDSFQDHLEKNLGERRLLMWNRRASQMSEASKGYFSRES